MCQYMSLELTQTHINADGMCKCGQKFSYSGPAEYQGHELNDTGGWRDIFTLPMELECLHCTRLIARLSMPCHEPPIVLVWLMSDELVLE